MKTLFNLEEYFYEDKYGIYFYDVLIKNSNYTREAILDELKIAYMSYSRAKIYNSKTSRLIIEKLNKKFKINELIIEKKQDYEQVLNSVIYKFYYKGEELNKYIPILNSYIADNNYLKPLFELLKLLIEISYVKSPQETYEEKKELISYLKKFNKYYFKSPFKEIFKIIELIFSGNKLVELDYTVDLSDNMKGLLYNAYISNAYLSKNYELCLYYIEECKKVLIAERNYKRLLSVDLMYFACLNVIGEYKKCKTEAMSQIRYLEEVESLEKSVITATKLHYYVACVGCMDYDDVISMIEKEDNYSGSDYMMLLVALYETNKKKYNELITKYFSEKNKFNEKQNKYLMLIINYLNSNNCKLSLKNEILNANINVGLKNILLKRYKNK